MNLDDARTPPCSVNEEQLIAYLDGELEGAPRERIAAHLASCPECAAVTEDAKLASEALGALPALRCPDHITTAAGEATSVDSLISQRRRSYALASIVALAASLALVLILSPQQSELTDAEKQRLLAVQRGLGEKAVDTGRRVLDRGFVHPTRQVIESVTDSQLGRWSSRVTSLFGTETQSPTDPT